MTRHYIYIYNPVTKEQRVFDVLINKPMNGKVYTEKYPCPYGWRYYGSPDKDVIWWSH